MSNRVMHFEIQADDIERAKNFYEKAFGWKIEKVMSKDDKGGMDYWGLMTGQEGTPGIDGGMYLRPRDEKIYTFDCTIVVEDIEKSMDDVNKNGGQIQSEKMEIPGVGWFARAVDSEKNKFGLLQPTGWQPK